MNSFEGTEEENFIAGQTIYLTILLSQSQGSKVSSANLSGSPVELLINNVAVTSGITVDSFDFATQTLKVSIIVPDKESIAAPWPTTAGGPELVEIDGTVNYIFGNFKRAVNDTKVFHTKFQASVSLVLGDTSVPEPEGAAASLALSLLAVMAAMLVLF